MAESVHASTSRPSAFRRGITSYIMFCGICCPLRVEFPAYIAGILAPYCIEERFHICHLYIAKWKFAILSPLLQKAHEFQIGSFEFRFIPDRDIVHFPNYSTFEITYVSNISTSPFRPIVTDLWASFLHIFFRVRFGKYKDFLSSLIIQSFASLSTSLPYCTFNIIA